MNELKRKLTENPGLKCGTGLKTATPDEIKEMCDWLGSRNIPYVYRATHLKTGKPLPHNGVLIVNINRGKYV